MNPMMIFVAFVVVCHSGVSGRTFPCKLLQCQYCSMPRVSRDCSYRCRTECSSRYMPQPTGFRSRYRQTSNVFRSEVTDAPKGTYFPNESPYYDPYGYRTAPQNFPIFSNPKPQYRNLNTPVVAEVFPDRPDDRRSHKTFGDLNQDLEELSPVSPVQPDRILVQEESLDVVQEPVQDFLEEGLIFPEELPSWQTAPAFIVDSVDSTRPRPLVPRPKLSGAVVPSPRPQPRDRPNFASATHQEECGIPPFYKPCVRFREADTRAMECCRSVPGLPQSCYRFCTMRITPALIAQFMNGDFCPKDLVQPVQNCLTNNQSVMQCCTDLGVPDPCNQFCDPRLGLPSMTQRESTGCISHLPSVKRCYMSTMRPEQ